MSLKRFLEDRDVTKKLITMFKKPKLDYSKEILAEPLTKNYSEVGIVFD